MAIAVSEIKKMQRDIATLKKEVAQLKRKNGKRREPKPVVLPARVSRTSENERVLALLRSKGMVSELPPEAKARAARWDALPEEEKKRISDEFFNLKLDKPLSDIIIENRS
jgi:hypothetical protein